MRAATGAQLLKAALSHTVEAPRPTSPRWGEVDAAPAAAGEGEQGSPEGAETPHPALRADLSPPGRGEGPRFPNAIALLLKSAPAFARLALALCAALAIAPASARSFTDSAGRTVEIPDAPKRVLAAGPPAAILLYVIAPDLMAGWVRAPSEAEKPFLLPETRDLPAYGRLTGRGGTANIEAVLAAKPDLIVDVGSVDPTYVSLADRVQAQTGVPYILIDGALADSMNALRALGRALGREERGEDLGQYAYILIEDISVELDKIPEEKRPRVYYARGPDGLETAPKGSITVETLDLVGAKNVAEGGKGLSRVSPEQILAWNPQAIVTLDPGFRARAARDPVWSGIDAVRNGRVYAGPTAPFGWLDAPPGVNRLLGVYWLASELYPEAFAVNDLRHETRQFYKQFYHVDVTDQQLDSLLKDAAPRP